MVRWTSKWVSILAALMLAALALPAFDGSTSHAQSGSQTFPQTGKTVQGKFLTYWNSHGGLAQQGLPISSEMQEKSETDGKTYTVQYFERAVFEAHPENQAPYDILLSLLGVSQLKLSHPLGVPGEKASTDNPLKFDKTSKVVGGKFRTYWESHGGLAQMGYPLTNEFQEVSQTDGKTYTVQYFERAVFEAHPENAAPNDVLLSLLGRFQYGRKYAAGTPKYGGTAVIAIGTDPGQLNPAITTSGNTHSVADQIYNGLVGLDDSLNPIPELAKSWEISSDGKTYTFHLQPNVKWHDGVAFTSADVKFSFEQALLKYHARTKAGLAPVLDGIDTPDTNTVVFRLKQPYGPLLQRLDVVEAPIIPMHIYQGKDVQNDPANLTPIGTGPFKFVGYVKGDNVTLQRNPDYFRAGLPYLDKVIYRIIPNASTAAQALEQGEVDYIGSVQGSDLQRLQNNKEITLAQGYGGSGGSVCQDTLIPNLTKSPFDKLQVRQAFYMALDRQFILNQVYFNQGTLSTGPISKQMVWAYTSDVTTYPYDVAMANQLLDQAGYPRGADGTRFAITFTHATSFDKLGAAMADELKQVGITLNQESLDFNTAVDKVFVKKNFDLGIASYCNGSDPEVGVRRAYVSSNIGPIAFSNGAGYKNPTVDQLFDQAAALTDRTQRAAIYAQIQKIITGDLPYFWLVDSQGYRAYRAVFKGFQVSKGPLVETAWTTDAGK
ncbi:MAG: ABC transporter substrate-binding protein [Chloroflexi bacterium]|nr:ABC transporter substrate-binding protein [Chloroflexota bacterium]